MKYKKCTIVLVLCLSIFIASIPSFAYALEDGVIDLYEVFSNTKDRMKTEVGSRIFKWSMHLPDDAVVYKSDRVNYFNMSTDSYKSQVSLEVIKNEQKYSLEDILYSKQMNTNDFNYYWYYSQKEFTFNIQQDDHGEKHIRIIKMDPYYDYYLVDAAAEEFSSYIENRIYIKNDYIYNLEIRMEGRYYRENPEMFSKLASSFILDYDENNPYIKELSDSVSEPRLYENTSYGWEITVNPYWKEEGISNARVQQFTAVYSHEEIYGNEKNEEAQESQTLLDHYLPFREGISVSLVSSAAANETAEIWGRQEIEQLQQNYNDKVYEILLTEKVTLGDVEGYRVKVKYSTAPQNPYIVDTLYVIGKGYKYRVVASISDNKYKEPKTKEAFESMLKSFKLTNQHSKYLGKILDPTDLINWNASKEIKTKKYNFKATLTRKWHTYDNFYSGNYYGYYDYYDKYYYGHISNQESVNAYQTGNNLNLMMMAGFDTRGIEDSIHDYVKNLLDRDEVRIGLASVDVSSTAVESVKLYRIITEYDLAGMNEFAENNATKSYDYNQLNNQYTYMIKVGNDLYTQTVSIPLANTTAYTKAEMEKVWKNTQINGINYSPKIKNWHQHKLSEFQDK
ncbi:hypothetical protein CACET_c33760 [Clostridium aceticum]|uniref:Uncharacterized protein n=1 Tax=Clostridium aceticum TaxID=84022 RepID=A0A0D8IBU6_9CLOT|nr:hypothetical protein [Clostridium aceticum]AKL96819.1 hypothetical protein CACET_c33760 [Clostridium aceticum]KJF27569.1 hypothetical protein TZ02_07225 [Clostridium aceticum]